MNNELSLSQEGVFSMEGFSWTEKHFERTICFYRMNACLLTLWHSAKQWMICWVVELW